MGTELFSRFSAEFYCMYGKLSIRSVKHKEEVYFTSYIYRYRHADCGFLTGHFYLCQSDPTLILYLKKHVQLQLPRNKLYWALLELLYLHANFSVLYSPASI